LSLSCCTLLNSPIRKLERLLGVTSHSSWLLLLHSTRTGVLGASCIGAAAAAATEGVPRASAKRWDALPGRPAPAAAAVPPCASPVPLPLLRLVATSEMVSTAKRRCHSLSPTRSNITRGLPGSSAAAAAAGCGALSGLEGEPAWTQSKRAQHSTAQHSAGTVDESPKAVTTHDCGSQWYSCTCRNEGTVCLRRLLVTQWTTASIHAYLCNCTYMPSPPP
jgi:hypothetical protein